MKIDFALMSCDENPFYKDFIPVVTAAWNKLGIKPVYVIITEGEAKSQDFGDRLEYHFKYIDNAKINFADPARKQLFQAEMARIWAWKHLHQNGIDGNCIFSDIDMMPLSKEYFCGTAEKYADHQMISYCNDAIDFFGQIASCYILGNTKVVSALIEQDNWYDFAWWNADNCGPTHGCDQWTLDWMLKKYEAMDPANVVRLKRGFKTDGSAYNRLDRINWNYDPAAVGNTLYDAHLLRPYSQYKSEVDKLLTLIP